MSNLDLKDNKITQLKNQTSEASPYNLNYDLLLNDMSMNKIIKRDIWRCEIDTMLSNYVKDVDEKKEPINFRRSGKILFSSSYLLKTKTKLIVSDSISTQEDIEEVENLEECEYYDDVYDSDYTEGSENKLENRINKLQLKKLSLKTLNEKISNREITLKSPKNLIYKKIDLNDLALALNDVMKLKNKSKSIKKSVKETQKQIDFLPKSLIQNKLEKRESLSVRINNFYDKLVSNYKDEPLSFIHLIGKPTRQNLINTLIYILHLSTKKKINIWQDLNYFKSDNVEEEDNAHTVNCIYISPIVK